MYFKIVFYYGDNITNLNPKIIRRVLETLLQVLGKPSYAVLQLSADELREKLLITNKTLEVSVRSILKTDENELLKLYDEYIRSVEGAQKSRIKGISVVWQSNSCVIMFNGLQLKVRSCKLSDELLKVLEVLKGTSIRLDATLR